MFNPADFDTEKRTWDKRMKTDFIQRLIDHAAKNGQPVVGCVAAKVVAGLEPNKTNELIQALANIARVRLSGQDALNIRPRTFTRPPGATKPVATSTSGPRLTAKNSNQPMAKQQTSSGSRVSSAHRLSIKSNRSDSIASSKSNISIRNETEVSNKSTDKQVGRRTSNVEPLRRSPVIQENPKIDEPELEIVKNSVPVPTVKQRQQVILTNESDINRHIPQLRSNLRHLRNVAGDLKQLDSEIKDLLA